MNAQPVIDALNQTLADLHVLNVKLHNYHWNIKGLQFFGIHELTEKYYDHLFKVFDDVAERILQLGGKPLATVKAYLDRAGLRDEPKQEFSPEDVLESLMQDFQKLLEDAKKTNALAEEAKDVPTMNLEGEFIQWLEKALWMLRYALKR